MSNIPGIARDARPSTVYNVAMQLPELHRYATRPGLFFTDDDGADGAWDPRHGLRFNPYKFLLDPYAKGVEGSMTLDPAAFAYDCTLKNGLIKGSAWGATNRLDSLGKVPISVAIDDRDVTKHDADPSHPHMPWSRTVIYELHVKGFTA